MSSNTKLRVKANEARHINIKKGPYGGTPPKNLFRSIVEKKQEHMSLWDTVKGLPPDLKGKKPLLLTNLWRFRVMHRFVPPIQYR